MVNRTRKYSLALFVLAAAVLSFSSRAMAIPAFARQTGLACVACHVSFPELTPFGRFFKLTAYTLSNKWTIPLAGMVQISQTNTRSINNTNYDFARNQDVVLQQASLFYGGRIAGPVGAFAQWTYDGIAHHSGIDNTDIRAAGHFTRDDVDFIYGVTVNNNPTVSDVWNTTPAFGFPYASSSISLTPTAGTLIDGGLAQQVAGVSGYPRENSGTFGIMRCGYLVDSCQQAGAHVSRVLKITLAHRIQTRRKAAVHIGVRHCVAGQRSIRPSTGLLASDSLFVKVVASIAGAARWNAARTTQHIPASANILRPGRMRVGTRRPRQDTR